MNLRLECASSSSVIVFLRAIRLDDRKCAVKEIERARKLAPLDQNVPLWAALVYEAAGDRDKALNCLPTATAGEYSLAII